MHRLDMKKTNNRLFPAWIFISILAFAACSAETYVKEADKEAYDILKEKTKSVFGKERPFALDSSGKEEESRLVKEIEEAKPGKGEKVKPLYLDLERSMETAALCSREFKNQKESLFLAALSLSNTRWEFDWQPGITGSMAIEGDRKARKTSGSIGMTMRKTMKTGAAILVNVFNSFFRSLTSGEPWSTTSLISLGITQPLLRGFGPDIVLERLTQAERDVVYAVRDFEQFRRRFAVQVVAGYYNLLLQQDRIAIEQTNLANLQLSLKQIQAKGKAGRIPKLQVDQNHQSVLRSKATLVRLEEALKAAKDNFKMTLGLPMEVEIQVEKKDFVTLRKEGLKRMALSVNTAQEIAMLYRLDLKTSGDRVLDTKRKVAIAADALRMGLDLKVDVNVPSQERKPVKPHWRETDWKGELSFDLPIDRTRQRNSYRGAIITYERALRNFDLQKDTVIKEIRARLRALKQTEQEYEIQKQSVLLARSRVDEAQTKQEAGRAIVRDVLEARESLVNAENALSKLLIDHLTTRLELLRDMDVLELDLEGFRYDDKLDTDRLLSQKEGE